MSLRVWLPLNGTLDNQGLDSAIIVAGTNTTFETNGKIGKCLASTGSTNNNVQITISNLETILANGNAYSVCLWVKLTNAATSGYILKIGDLPGGLWWTNVVSSSNTHRYVWNEGDSGKVLTKGDVSIDYDYWHHICVIIDKTELGYIKETYYIDGELTTGTGVTNPFRFSSNGLTTLTGTNIIICPFIAKINDFRIYNHVLSAIEVKQISQGLILHYPLNNNGWGKNNLGLDTAGERTFKNSTLHYNLAQGVPNLIKGQAVTISADLKSTIDNSQLDCYVRSSTQSRMNDLAFIKGITTQYKRYAKTVVVPDNDLTPAWFTFRSSSGGSGNTTTATFSIKNAKIELGDKATTWSPNNTEELYELLGIDNEVEYDCSGYKNNGVKEGTFAYTSNTPKYNVSSIFNGAENIKRDTLEGEIYTLTCWARTTKDKKTSQIMVADSKSQMSISFYKGTVIGVFGTTRGTGSKSILGNSYKENEWNHFAVVKTNTSGGRAIYCNGVLLTPASNDYWSSVAGFFVGTRNNSQGLPFYGEICDIRAYATALSAEDILSLYNNEAYIDNNGNIYGAVYEEG